MKKLIALSLLIIISISNMAQSTDFLYPYGRWQSMPESGGYVELFILRDRNAYHNFNTTGIGSLSITDKNYNIIYESILRYDGKEIKGGTYIYYFQVRSEQGRSSRIGTQKVVDEEGLSVKIVEITGELTNRVELKEKLGWVEAFNGVNYDPTSEAASDQELLNMLRNGIKEGLNIRGFGNLQQYVNAHTGLDMSKPIYAKPKGAGNIYIFKEDDLQSAKIGVLKPGNALRVVNEYNGWCEVENYDKARGFVSLSAVTLTNVTESASTASVATTSVATPVPADAQNCRKERLTVMNGGTLNPYNVVCGSFDNIDEANNLRKTLIAKKYSAQVAQNPDTGRYRVIAASFDNYDSAVQSRNRLRSAYPDAWLLYRIY